MKKFALLLSLATCFGQLEAEDNFLNTIAKWTMPALKFLTFASGVYIAYDLAKHNQELEHKLNKQNAKIKSGKAVLKKLIQNQKKQANEIKALKEAKLQKDDFLKLQAQCEDHNKSIKTLHSQIADIQSDSISKKSLISSQKNIEKNIQNQLQKQVDDLNKGMDNRYNQMIKILKEDARNNIAREINENIFRYDVAALHNKMDFFFAAMKLNASTGNINPKINALIKANNTHFEKWN